MSWPGTNWYTSDLKASCGCGNNECPLAPPSVSVLLHWWQCFLDFNIKANVNY